MDGKNKLLLEICVLISGTSIIWALFLNISPQSFTGADLSEKTVILQVKSFPETKKSSEKKTEQEQKLIEEAKEPVEEIKELREEVKEEKKPVLGGSACKPPF